MSVPNVDFWSVPTEIAEQALALCHPRDVAAFTQTCWAAWSLVNDSTDQYLWRQLFLLFPFDDPRNTPKGFRKDIHFDWKTELQHRVHAGIIARSARSSPEDLHVALDILLGIVRSASPVILGHEHVPSSSLQWVMDVLESTDVLQLPPSVTQRHTSQTLARLRSYLALTLDEFDSDEGKSRMRLIRTSSRCHVYDLKNYNGDNDWGPFMLKTGEVDWFHVECIVNVITFNLADHSGHFLNARPPCGLEATRAYSAPHATSLVPHDWAGVEGNWRRIVSFMDHRDLFAFNFSIRGSGRAHGGSFFEDPNFSEATRLIELKFHLISPDAIPKYYTLNRFPQSEDANYPTLYFSGSSHGIHGNQTTVVGSVYMADDDVVRWRFVSAREGHMQWSSEGVQIGGIASAMGVVGTWTGAYHERGDPAGPFWLWKVPDDYPTSIRALIPVD